MCQSVPPGYQEDPLPAHKYPVWITAFAAVVLLVLCYSLLSVPSTVAAAKQLQAARSSYRAGDLDKSLGLYKTILKKFPDSQTARIGTAEALFTLGRQRHDQSLDEQALEQLWGLSLDSSDCDRLNEVMPRSYWQLFEKDGKYALKLASPHPFKDLQRESPAEK